MNKPTVNVLMKNEYIYLISHENIVDSEYFVDILKLPHANAGQSDDKTKYYITAKLIPIVAFILRYALTFFRVNPIGDVFTTLTEYANQVPYPRAVMDTDKKRIVLVLPFVSYYTSMMNSLNAGKPKTGHYTIPLNRAIELKTALDNVKSFYPKPVLSDEVADLFMKPIPGFDGSIESLKNIPLDVLVTINTNVQNKEQRQTNSKPLAEKYKDFGVENLYDLLFEMPRRYIDKSNPKGVDELVVGEEATIVGTIDNLSTFGSGKKSGLNIDVMLDGGGIVRCPFFKGEWMSRVYKVGNEVIVTGKYRPWRDVKQLSSPLIDFLENAASMPITPIYRQAASKGIKTINTMRAVQELITRIGDVELPFYLREISADKEGFKEGTYADLIGSVHLPESMKEREEALKRLAFYELIEMQIIIQSRKKELATQETVGVEHKRYSDKAYTTVIENLPFSLTGDQNKALEHIMKQMESPRAMSTLLSGDVGSGKSVCAFMPALVSADSGYQSAIIAPTEILARQLYQNLQKMVNDAYQNRPDHEKPKIMFYTGTMKVAAKKPVLQAAKDGTVDILVGTHGLATKTVKYNNLGFVAIDEQQKLGAEQRSNLLSARKDGRVPDFLQMTATPIPRTIAQSFYGDIDFITLQEKPAGRKPIQTQWLESSPQTVVQTIMHPIWSDIKKEVQQGRKAFVIAPLVEESEKVDASSVEETYKSLKDGALAGVRVGFVHGKVKSEIAEQTMKEFRDGKYDVLVASTVVEVGVDIKEATRMVVLSADRLGASTLHQIRGRVGRNDYQSKCYLVAHNVTDSGRERLQALVNSDNGFEIAKSDTLSRGEGTLFGDTQSGKSEFTFLRLARHGRWISRSIDIAKTILDEHGKAAVDVCKQKYSVDSRML